MAAAAVPIAMMMNQQNQAGNDAMMQAVASATGKPNAPISHSNDGKLTEMLIDSLSKKSNVEKPAEHVMAPFEIQQQDLSTPMKFPTVGDSLRKQKFGGF